jgi:hypothetical protein
MSKELEAIVAEMRSYDGDPFGQAHHKFHEWADRLEALSTQSGEGWRDIATAPKNEPVLVFASDQQFVAWFQDDATDPWREVGDAESDWNQSWLVTDNRNGPYPLRGGRPTKWRPLPPSPPSDTKGEG